MAHGLNLKDTEIRSELERLWQSLDLEQKAAIDYAVNQHVTRMADSIPSGKLLLDNERTRAAYKDNLLADIYTAQIKIDVYEKAYAERPQQVESAAVGT